MIWTNRNAKNTVLICGLLLVAAILLFAVSGCTTTTPEPTGEPTPTPTMETSPISPVVTPAIPDLVPVPAVTYEPHPIAITAARIITFSLDLTCDVYTELDPDELTPEEFAGALQYKLIAMSRVKHNGIVVAQGEFDTGLGPYSETEAQPGPCIGTFATLHFTVNRDEYDSDKLYTFWVYGRWEAPQQYDLPIVYLRPGPDEIVDGAGYSYMGNFRGAARNIYLPIFMKGDMAK